MESIKYLCIFENKQCPAKAAWKLSPESLVEFCKVCVEKMKWDTLVKGIEAVASLQKNAGPNDIELEKLRMAHEKEMKQLDIELEMKKREAYKEKTHPSCSFK